MSLVETTVKIPNAVGKEEPYTRSREDVEAWAMYGNLDAVKVSAKVILIQITLLNLLCHFALAFSCFLRILQLKSEVGLESNLHCWLAEHGPVRDIAHQQLNNIEQLSSCLGKAKRTVTRGGLASGSSEMLVGLGVAQLDSSDATKVEEESCNLVVDSVLGELKVDLNKDTEENVDLRNEVLSLLLRAVLSMSLGLINFHFRATLSAEGNVLALNGNEKRLHNSARVGSSWEGFGDDLGDDVGSQTLAENRDRSQGAERESGVEEGNGTVYQSKVALDLYVMTQILNNRVNLFLFLFLAHCHIAFGIGRCLIGLFRLGRRNDNCHLFIGILSGLLALGLCAVRHLDVLVFLDIVPSRLLAIIVRCLAGHDCGFEYVMRRSKSKSVEAEAVDDDSGRRL
ncbi:hypothetical protein HG530_008863 [Fusarium avenaceum]|nr:hypothetical protein HG530_008863 [Fusarium avenaceum]